ncbi:MAG: hypothetical protein ACSLFK_10285 [Gemmatimonadaceae bacterium]
MAEPLKKSFDERIPRAIARQIKAAWPPFDAEKFLEDALHGYQGLELLKDDPEIYVRRSVANNLNDIGKDHPEVLVPGRHIVDVLVNGRLTSLGSFDVI